MPPGRCRLQSRCGLPSSRHCEAAPRCAAVQALLTSIIAAPNAPVDSLCFVTDAERAVLLHSFSGPHLAPPQQTIHGMLEHWAAATPDAPAVSFEVWAGCALKRK